MKKRILYQEQRYEQILSMLSERGFLTVRDAVERFEISPITVRRDFNELAERQLVDRTRGGIRLQRNKRDDGSPPVDLAVVRHAKEKEAIARRAVSLLKPNDVIILDGGTTTLYMAQYLPPYPLKVIMNSLPHAMAIIENGGDRSPIEIFMAGGCLHMSWLLTLGPQTRASYAQYHANWAFLSSGGINEQGLFNPNEQIAEIQRTMMANANHVAVLADHSKIGANAMCFVCELERLDYLITNEDPSTIKSLDLFREAGIEVMTAQV